jgi:transposase
MDVSAVIQVTAQTRILVAVEHADFRKGIDGLAALCRQKLAADPFSGTVFVFRNRRATAIKAITFDGQGYWLFQKRLSKGRFKYWPTSEDASTRALLAHELQVLMSGGDPEGTRAAPPWRRVVTCAEGI